MYIGVAKKYTMSRNNASTTQRMSDEEDYESDIDTNNISSRDENVDPAISNNVNRSNGEEGRETRDVIELYTTARQKVTDQKKEIDELIRKNKQMAACLKMNRGNHRGTNDLLGKTKNFQMKNRRNQIVDIMKDYIFPQTKWQTDTQLLCYDNKSVGKIVMNKMKVPEERKSTFWHSSFRLVKQMFRDHRHYISRNTKVRVVNGKRSCNSFHT